MGTFYLTPENVNSSLYLKFNAKDKRFYTKTEDGQNREVTDMTAIVDLEYIVSAWILFEEGVPPDIVRDSGDGPAPRPSARHKRGFEVRVFAPNNIGGLRNFSSNSNVVNRAMAELYDAFKDAPERKQGLVPLVRCENSLPVKSKFGTNYQPVFRIVKWVERPEALNGTAGSPPLQPQPEPAPKPGAPWALPVKPEPSPELLVDGIPEF